MKISIRVPSPATTSVWDQCIKSHRSFATGDLAELCFTVDVQMAHGSCPASKTSQRVAHQLLNSVRFLFVVVASNFFSNSLFYFLYKTHFLTLFFITNPNKLLNCSIESVDQEANLSSFYTLY